MARRIHFIGIGGTGMAGAAGIALRLGWEVRGSDGPLYPPMSDVLSALGIHVYEGYSPQNLSWGPDVVVVGNVCTRDHVEARAAFGLPGVEVTSFPAFLEKYVLPGTLPVVVAGTHGKTTTTTLISFLMERIGAAPGYLIGGQPLDLEFGFAAGTGSYFVLEGDEYDTAFFDKGPKFLHYRPRALQLTSIEYDHADIYPDISSLVASFRRLVGLVPYGAPLMVAREAGLALEIVASRPHHTYGLEGEGADWEARRIERHAGITTFELWHGGAPVHTFETRLIGEHNLRNVTGALALLISLGFAPARLADPLREFRGVRRRQEVLVKGPVTVLDDFGHHPTAISYTLKAIREAYSPARLVAAFEPRSATSRRAVFQEKYAAALAEADVVIVSPPYDQSKIPAGDRFSSERLVEDLRREGTEALLVKSPQEAGEAAARMAQEGDVVVFFSSGSFGGAPLIAARMLSERGGAALANRV